MLAVQGGFKGGQNFSNYSETSERFLSLIANNKYGDNFMF